MSVHYYPLVFIVRGQRATSLYSEQRHASNSYLSDSKNGLLGMLRFESYQDKPPYLKTINSGFSINELTRISCSPYIQVE